MGIIAIKTNPIIEMSKKVKFNYHHLGIPTDKPIEGEVYLKDYKVYHYGYDKSDYGIEWMRYEKDCQLPEIVKTIPHVAFEVADIYEAIRGKNVIIEPNSPSEGNIVAFIEENGAPIEFIQTRKGKRKQYGNDA
ncbi:MAG: hypothetical protein NTW10_09850 [Bacteroidetes bacterium]|nr:hypothetical protein [Bacteroidota bacterium]